MLEKIRNAELFILDFSAIANIKSADQLQILNKFILDNSLKVAVNYEFYENYEVIIKTVNEEQRTIANLAYRFLSILKKNSCLLYMAEQRNAEDIISSLYRNEKVCFVFYKNSEFSESLLSFLEKEDYKAKAIIVSENGEMNSYDTLAEIKAAVTNVIDPTIAGDDYFAVSFVPNPGETVKTSEGTQILLGELIGSGGEGAVYHCDYEENYVVKIYHKGQLNKLRLKKIFQMEKKQVRYNGICWPEKVIFSMKGEPVGYLMKQVEGRPLSSIFDSDEDVLKAFPTWNKQDLIALTIDILQKIQYLHLFGILIGDLRMKNIVINEAGIPSIVDIDSCQIDNLPCPAGYPDYTPPELQHVAFKKNLRTYRNESFSCAVLMFKLLFCGLHPYDQRHGADSIEEEISLHSFPYPMDYTGDFSRIPWGSYKGMWEHMPFQFQMFLQDIFKNGERYSLQQMIWMLKNYYRYLETRTDFEALNNIVHEVNEE